MLTPEQQAAFVAEEPAIFLPIPGGWGRNGATHIRLAAANEDLLAGALRTAWKLRVEKNQKSNNQKSGRKPKSKSGRKPKSSSAASPARAESKLARSVSKARPES